MNKNKALVYAAITVISLVIVSAGLTLLKLSFLQSLRIVFGSFYVLFLPGFILTYLFFKEIDWIERVALSFALSIATVPLVLFYLNKIGVRITALSSTLTILGIIILGLAIAKIIGMRNKPLKKEKIQIKIKNKP